MLKVDANHYLENIVVGSENEELIMCGVSYWNQVDGEFLCKMLDEAVCNGGFEELFWDDLVKNNLNHLKIKVRELKADDLFEIDSLKELEEVEAYLTR